MDKPLAGLKVVELAQSRLGHGPGNCPPIWAPRRSRSNGVPVIAQRHRDELLAALAAAGIPAGPINDVAQVFADPQGPRAACGSIPAACRASPRRS